MPMNQFQSYIQKHGIETCARKWGVAISTVYNWRRGTTWPARFKHLPVILKTTRLTETQIYQR
jgi:hypothetical protein